MQIFGLFSLLVMASAEAQLSAENAYRGVTLGEWKARAQDFESRLGSYRMSFRYTISRTPEEAVFLRRLAQVGSRRGPAPAEAGEARTVRTLVLATDASGQMVARDSDGAERVLFWGPIEMAQGEGGAVARIRDVARPPDELCISPLFGSVVVGTHKITQLIEEAEKTGKVTIKNLPRGDRTLPVVEVRTDFPPTGTAGLHSFFWRFYLDSSHGGAVIYLEHGVTGRRHQGDPMHPFFRPVLGEDVALWEQVFQQAEFREYEEVRPGVFLPRVICITHLDTLPWAEPNKVPRDWEWREFRSVIRVIELLRFEPGVVREEFVSRLPTGIEVADAYGGWRYAVGGLLLGQKRLALELQYDGPDLRD